MEGTKKQEVSSYSFTADLFDTKESSSSSSTGIFASMFLPPSPVLGRKSPSSDANGIWQKQAHGNQLWNTNPATSVMKSEAASYNNMANKERNFQEEKMEPCNLSSSLYYGGQDHYSQSASYAHHSNGSYPLFKKDGGENDPNGQNPNDACRGNWWQGSLYY